MTRFGGIVGVAACLAAGSIWGQGIVDHLPPEIHRTSGDNVQPFFEGWQKNPNGTIRMWFGYLNRNFEEQVDVPVGPENHFDMGDDQGQPTHFYPRRQQFVFKIDLPRDWDQSKHVVWTVTAHGKTSSANGWLQPQWEVDDGVRMMNLSFGATPPTVNEPPRLSGDSSLTTEVGQSARLTIWATDDGIPTNRTVKGGLWIRWILYRGPGQVTFAPDRTNPGRVKPIRMNSELTFSAPGTYWLRAIASDGMLETSYDVRVVVKAPR